MQKYVLTHYLSQKSIYQQVCLQNRKFWNKTKYFYFVKLTVKTADKLLIQCEERESGKLHPHCPHGPTLYFYRGYTCDAQGFYACAAARDKRFCNFHLLASEMTDKQLNRRYELPVSEYRLRRKRVDAHKCTKANLTFF